MLLITIFVELRVIAERWQPTGLLDSGTVPWPRDEGHGDSMAWARHAKCE
jgi:hypothetical protein